MFKQWTLCSFSQSFNTFLVEYLLVGALLNTGHTMLNETDEVPSEVPAHTGLTS